MNLFDDLRTQRAGVPSQRLSIRHFDGAHARKLAIDQIGPDLALHHGKAPVADMFQQQHTQNDLGRNTKPSARPALRVPFDKTLINCVDQLIVFQNLVRLTHPWIP
jgi:hypothetical protein